MVLVGVLVLVGVDVFVGVGVFVERGVMVGVGVFVGVGVLVGARPIVRGISPVLNATITAVKTPNGTSSNLEVMVVLKYDIRPKNARPRSIAIVVNVAALIDMLRFSLYL